MRLNPPLWLMLVLYYGSLLLSLTLCIVFSPLILAYALALFCSVWLRWHPRGKDVLTVVANVPSCQERMKGVLPLLGSRSEFLNWSERRTWERWSLTVRLFRLHAFFGPVPFRREQTLPLVMIFRRFRWPKKFDFSKRENDVDVLERLRQELAVQ